MIPLPQRFLIQVFHCFDGSRELSFTDQNILNDCKTSIDCCLKNMRQREKKELFKIVKFYLPVIEFDSTNPSLIVISSPSRRAADSELSIRTSESSERIVGILSDSSLMIGITSCRTV